MTRLPILACSFLLLLAARAPLPAQMGGEPGAQTETAFGGGRMVQGTVTSVAGGQISLKTEAGDLYRIDITPNTQVRKDRAQVKLSEIHAGDGVGAMGELDRPNRTVHALMVYVVDAEQIRKARENLGKTYIAGKITAIDLDDLKLTVLRSDNITQVIRVDEGTSFKRGGRGMGQALGFGAGGRAPAEPTSAPAAESITLADIKVGDLVGGPGAVRGGVFIPTELSVGTPGAHGGRRRGDGSAPPPTGPAAAQGPR